MGIKDLFKWFIEDTKKDIDFFRRLSDGTYKFPYTKEQLKEAFNPLNILKANWYWFILLIAAFLAGYFIASVYLGNSCIAWVEASGLLNKTVEPMFNLTLS